ncbi:hypothetical protein [Sphingobium baderi]|uniref:hypothetical protein n=1 Tax=Sphingobium baderi TaxID=1332080 RepID=UPI002B405756|nr:hypothetical protein [Sphingobium baderi]WRD78869.1 hypothetical protein QQ987_19575 [Sphingobium baderi]
MTIFLRQGAVRGAHVMQWARSNVSGLPSRCKALLGIVMLTAAFVMEPASGEQTSGKIGVRTTVPVICRAKTEASFPTLLHNGHNDLGHAEAYCNAYRGYRLILQHGVVPDGTLLLVDNRVIPATSGTTQTLLEEGNRPLYHERRHLGLVLPGNGSAHLGLRLLLQPLN